LGDPGRPGLKDLTELFSDLGMTNRLADQGRSLPACLSAPQNEPHVTS
jgi:hypothetical protein